MSAKVFKVDATVFTERRGRITVVKPRSFLGRWLDRLFREGRSLEYLEWVGGF